MLCTEKGVDVGRHIDGRGRGAEGEGEGELVHLFFLLMRVLLTCGQGSP